MANLFTNLGGAINAQVTITSEMVSEEYKLTYTCSSIGAGNSFLLIKGSNTYFFPLQFVGQQEVKFKASFSGVVTCVLKGDVTINGLTLATYSNVSQGDRTALELVKKNGSYWDQIINKVNEAGKLRADMMEGIINLTTNAFKNESGTITQENGIMTFMDGTSYATSTMAVQIAGGAIAISNNKDGNGGWVWTTSINGAGISAKTIIANTFDALEIRGAKMITGSIESVDISSVTIKSSTLLSGTIESGTYIKVDSSGNIVGYKNGVKVMSISVQGTTYPTIKLSTNCDDFYAKSLEVSEIHNANTNETEFYIAANNAPLFIGATNIKVIAYDQLYLQGGTGGLHLNGGYGDIHCDGAIFDQQGQLIVGGSN